jgi:hypothetical protein
MIYFLPVSAIPIFPLMVFNEHAIVFIRPVFHRDAADDVPETSLNTGQDPA